MAKGKCPIDECNNYTYTARYYIGVGAHAAVLSDFHKVELNFQLSEQLHLRASYFLV